MVKHAFVQNIKGEDMKKAMLLTLMVTILGLSACAFHGKQEKDDAYYKRTQSVEWPST